MKFKTTLSTFVLATVVLLAGCSNDENTDVNLAPKISVNDPADNATDVELSAIITATFDDAMSPTTINTSTFTLKQGETDVEGTVSYTGSTASFEPSELLEQNTTYTATITTGVKNIVGRALDSNYTFSFTTMVVPDSTLPTIVSTSPLNDDSNVAQNKIITVEFNETMDASTINDLTFTLKQGSIVVPGAVNYSGTTATFTPTDLMAAGTIYTALLTKGAKDLVGNALAADKEWSFTIEVLPLINSVYPLNNAINVVPNTLVLAVFNKTMDASTINDLTFTLKQGSTVVPGAVSYSGKTATFTPTNIMAAGTKYTALLTKDAKDLAGNALAADKEWSFTTEASPLVNSVYPLNNATNVVLNTLVSVVFDKTMDDSTITDLTFTLKEGNTVIPGAVSYSGKTATFKATNLLAAGTTYTALMTKEVKDLAGNAIAADIEWSFKTKVATANLAVVNLKTSENYVILAKTAINNNPTSNITGDLGLSPAATSYITGFALTDFTGYATSAQITGKVYAADMVTPTSGNLTTAVEDMILAYTDAAGRPTPDFLNLGSGNLGGKTLSPGLYKFTSSVTLPTDVTISGGANDVWIFQISGDLSESANVNVTLAGGAQAKNIFWQVAGEAVFGATSHFEGIILSWTGITFQTGATFKGRALAGTAVILDANTVVGPN